jgi:hypothetical protein
MIFSDLWDVSNAMGSTVVTEGISGMRDEELRMGKMRRMMIAVRIIPLRMGAAF